MPMDPGKLRHRVTFKAPATAQDAAGQPVAGFTDVCTVWADVRYQGGLESLKADAPTSTARASIRIRRRSDVHAGLVVAHGAVLFNVTAVLPDEQGREYLDVVCEVVR